jgi:nucleoside-diphosphate-sugar epimerase
MISTKSQGPNGPSRSAVVFGGSGFIGTHLVRELAASGTRVVVADVKPPQDMPPGVCFEMCDVRLPITLARAEPFDRVYNLAAVHRTPGHEPFEYYEANVRGALNIADWMQAGGESELCFTSSIAVYGPSEELKSERTPSSPTSDYGRSKLLAEEIFGRWQTSAPGRKLVVIRPAVVFGPGEGGNFTRLAKALSRRAFVYPGRNDVIKSGGYVQDLVKAMIFAGDLSDPTLLFNYCYPHRSTIREICEAFHRVAGYHLPPMLSPAIIKVVIAVLKVINPSEKGSLSAARVKKLTASTNITPDELIRRGFTWDTDMESALRKWRELSPERFV